METVHTIGRRKESVARIYITKGTGKISVNGKDHKEYFSVETLKYKLNQPFKVIDQEGKFDVDVKVNGGGINGQADAIKLGVARALCYMSPENRAPLKSEGFLTRDSRRKERKKYGLRKARKAPQFSKR